jgi:hypothetical protein
LEFSTSYTNIKELSASRFFQTAAAVGYLDGYPCPVNTRSYDFVSFFAFICEVVEKQRAAHRAVPLVSLITKGGHAGRPYSD